jgi:hypothetical protein
VLRFFFTAELIETEEVLGLLTRLRARSPKLRRSPDVFWFVCINRIQG